MARTHGQTGTPEYRTWENMRKRCYYAKDKAFAYYGARGVTVCERWRGSFQSFLEDMGQRPSYDHSLDRIDNSKGYEPGNCRWSSRREQQNNRTDSVMITVDDREMTVTEWAREKGMSGRALTYRWRKGVRGTDLFRGSRSDLIARAQMRREV